MDVDNTFEITWVSETDEKTMYFPAPDRPAPLQGKLSATLEVRWGNKPGIAVFEFYPLLDGNPVVAPTRQDIMDISKYMSKLVYGFSIQYTPKYNPNGPLNMPFRNGRVLTKITACPASTTSVRSYWK